MSGHYVQREKMKTLLYISLAFYLVGVSQTVLLFLRKQRLPQAVTLLAVFGGFILHSSALVMRGIEVGRCPLKFVPEVLAFLGWSLAAYYLISSLWDRKRVFQNYVFPLGFITTLAAAVIPLPEVATPVLKVTGTSYLFPVHVSLVIFAFAAFFITFITGVMYILQERELKLKRFSSIFFRLPALDTCDDISYKSMSIGFMLLTIGLVTGIIWSGRRSGVYWHGDPIEIISMLTWMIYLFIIHYRVTAGWRGRRAAIVAIIGFAFVVASLMGLRFFHVSQG